MSLGREFSGPKWKKEIFSVFRIRVCQAWAKQALAHHLYRFFFLVCLSVVYFIMFQQFESLLKTQIQLLPVRYLIVFQYKLISG